jgi:hypothetical protein
MGAVQEAGLRLQQAAQEKRLEMHKELKHTLLRRAVKEGWTHF